jgi:hypothetical protein
MLIVSSGSIWTATRKDILPPNRDLPQRQAYRDIGDARAICKLPIPAILQNTLSETAMRKILTASFAALATLGWAAAGASPPANPADHHDPKDDHADKDHHDDAKKDGKHDEHHDDDHHDDAKGGTPKR